MRKVCSSAFGRAPMLMLRPAACAPLPHFMMKATKATRTIASSASLRSRRVAIAATHEFSSGLGPDPSRDNFDELYRTAANSSIVDLLARSALPKDVGAVLRSQIYWLAPPFGQSRSADTLQRLFQAGARWETSTTEGIGDIRRSLLRMSDWTFVDTMRLLAKDDYCSSTILQNLAKTPTIRARMKKVGFIPSPADPKRDFYQSRSTRSREVLAKCGIQLSKPKPRLPTRSR
jgi:hypothetical protein